MAKFNIKTALALCLLFIISCSKEDKNSPLTETVPNNESTTVISDTSQGKIKSILTIGGSNNDSAQAIVSTSDGGYAILGYTQSTDGDVTSKTNDSFDYWLLKYSAKNVLEWKKSYGGTADDRGFDLAHTKDGGFILIGRTNSINGDISNNAGFEDYWALKVNALGDIIWQKTFGFEGSDVGFSVIETNDGGYLFLGVLDVTASGGQGDSARSVTAKKHAGGDYWVVKVNIDGETSWTKYFGGSLTDTAEAIIQTKDNGYLIVGWSDSTDFDIKNNKGTYDFWIVKINSVGILEWEKNYGGTEIDEAFAIAASNDGNYLIAGTTRSNDKDISKNNGGADFWVIKITPLGEKIWEKNYGGTEFDVARSISKTKDGGFVLAGSSRSQDIDVTNNQGQNDGWVIKIDPKGDLKWEASIGGTNIDFLYDAVELTNKSIIAVGETFSNDGAIKENKGFSDVLITKIN